MKVKAVKVHPNPVEEVPVVVRVQKMVPRCRALKTDGLQCPRAGFHSGYVEGHDNVPLCGQHAKRAAWPR